jgi:hypothetical protein
MQAKLKELFSLDFDLATFWPEKPDNFGFWLRAMIGPEDHAGADSFDIHVCTPEWLKSNYSVSDTVWGRHFLIVFEYDRARIEAAIVRYCERCFGNDWQEIAQKISRIGYWEFEDYREYGKASKE